MIFYFILANRFKIYNHMKVQNLLKYKFHFKPLTSKKMLILIAKIIANNSNTNINIRKVLI